MRSTTSAWLLALILLASGCSSSTEVTCTLIGIPAVTVRVRDAVTGAFIAGDATFIETHDGETKSRQLPDDRANDAMWLIDEFLEPGTYDLTVRKPGYRDWARVGVRVENDGGPCNRPETVRLEALLSPTS
jgi:hypothetical protein